MDRENLKALTSLRFLAALSIVWLHSKLYFDWAKIGPSDFWDHGVSFFFVLSGFILTHAHSGGIPSYWQFIKGRVARLWPLHLLCLAAVILFVPADSQSFDGSGIYGKWISLLPNALLLQSWIPSLASAFSWNSVSWSISTEMFFYAMFPLMLALLIRNKAGFALVWLLPLPIVWLAARWMNLPLSGDVFSLSGDALFRSFPPSRLLEFGAGMVGCKIWQRLKGRPMDVMQASLIEFCAVGMIVVWFGWMHQLLEGPSHISATLSLWAQRSGSFPIFAIVIPMLASGRGVIGKSLSVRPLIILGEASFALYLCHQIIMKVIALSAPEFGAPILVLGSCIAIALALHFIIERPARRLIAQGRWRGPWPLTVPISLHRRS